MKRVPSGGYTIIEVMIFLVVSAALLTSAMALISGKEERTRFSQAATMLEQNIKDTLNDVSTGFYPSNNRITCTTNGNGTISITSGTAEQGSQGCLFLGKAMRFERNSEKYEVYTMAASKNATGLGTGTTGANTQLLGGPSPGPPSGNNPGIVTTYDLSSDLKIVMAVSLENNLREV